MPAIHQPTQAVFYVEQAPQFDYRDGLFHITQTIGEYTFVRVMRPSTFMVSLRRAAECAREHNFAGAEVVQFAKRSESATG